MKTIFFIDGENFVYQLRDTLAKGRLIRYRDELARVDIRKLFVNTLQDETVKDSSIRYYASKIHIIDRTPELKERTERYLADSEVWQKVLADQKVEYIEAGHLLVRDGKPCVECGHREPVLTEKGTDVTIATDLIRASGENVRLVLLSSDGDLMPAVEEAKRRGSELIYVGFRGVSNAALARAATSRFTVTTKLAAAVLAPKSKSDPEPKARPKVGEVKKTAQAHNHAQQQAQNQPEQQSQLPENVDKADQAEPQKPQSQKSQSQQRQRGGQNGNGQNRRNNNRQQNAPDQAHVFTGSRLASILPAPVVAKAVKPARSKIAKPAVTKKSSQEPSNG